MLPLNTGFGCSRQTYSSALLERIKKGLGEWFAPQEKERAEGWLAAQNELKAKGGVMPWCIDKLPGAFSIGNNYASTSVWRRGYAAPSRASQKHHPNPCD